MSDGSTEWTCRPATRRPYTPAWCLSAETDRTIHAVRASDGAGIWRTDRAGAPFYANPLVVGTWVFVGARDGYFYCFDRGTGALLWHYKTDSPISVSAAYEVYDDAPDGVVYFANQGGCAYALAAADGAELWATCDLPGGGFLSYWPVVVGDHVPPRCGKRLSDCGHPRSQRTGTRRRSAG